MDERVHLFGIRHHGPGSTASLLVALEALQPAVVLIEGPPEADGLITYASLPGMKPPVALLAYAAEDPAQSSFFPFASFSPEWQAMRWAGRHDRPVRFIDLPIGASLAARMQPEPPETAGDGEAEATEDGLLQDSLFQGDPLDRLAEISGHADGEAFWNALVESRGAAREVFAVIAEAMTALRAGFPEDPARSPAALREARREAHMRLRIRDALKETEGPVAVVCGAWHVPALTRKVAIADDKALLKDLPKTKVEVTWVPWTETRLAAASGYGAGVSSPGWYGHLWSLYEDQPAAMEPDVFASTWQTRVATLLREEGLGASTASVIEASRLATGLAALRDLAVPGLAEMRDATLAALCHGDEAPFRVVERRLIIGEAVGELDENVPQMPLAADLALWQKRLRLKLEAVAQEVSLDLRSEAGLAKSTLLHRLDLLGVTWGRLSGSGSGRGTFREIWVLAWTPELSVKLAEALIHGVTVEQAAGGAAVARASTTRDVRLLADLVRLCLMSDLPQAAERCIGLLQAAAVDAADVVSLMQAVPPLVSVLRYGTARKMPTEALASLAKAMAVEVNAGLGLAAANLDDDAAAAMRKAMVEFDDALNLLDDSHLSHEWLQRLRHLSGDASVTPLIAGLGLRRLYDRSALGEGEAAVAFSWALSPGNAPKAAGQWLEGFLGNSAEVILQDPALFALVDGWLNEQEPTDFTEVLPMLRRAFSGFGISERRRLMAEVAKATSGRQALPKHSGDDLAAPGFAAALPLLTTILGLDAYDR